MSDLEEKTAGTKYTFSCGVLFAIAKEAFERTKSLGTEIDGGQRDTLVAILFSAAALEAYIGELGLVAGSGVPERSNPLLKGLGAVLAETESVRGSTRLKYTLANILLSGKPYEKGEAPYQDFDFLVKLRDAIEPVKVGDESFKIYLALKAKGLAAAPRPEEMSDSWLHWITTRAVATSTV